MFVLVQSRRINMRHVTDWLPREERYVELFFNGSENSLDGDAAVRCIVLGFGTEDDRDQFLKVLDDMLSVSVLNY